MPNPSQSFDRVRPRDAEAGAATLSVTTSDREGKRALFSEVTSPPSTGSVALTCSRCGVRSVVSVASLWRASLPVPVMIPGQGLRASLKCPACGERNWMAVSLRK